jgi:hypothetical protein
MIKISKLLRKYWVEIPFFCFFFAFSWWLMTKTFDYKNGQIYIAAKAWSDFSVNIPRIRLFSFGQNFPPQDPLFGGEPDHYHFLFYLLVGLLEKIGIPLNFALNIPSAFGFFLMLLMVFLLGKILFKNKGVAFLGVIFLLFNGSFSFLEFFKTHSIFSRQTFFDIISNLYFPSFGPYDQKIVSAFWNLNIYTNQRHLAAAFGLILLLCLLIIKPEIEGKIITFKRALILGLLLAFMPYLHSVGFVSAIIITVILFIFLPRQRKPLYLSLGIGISLGLPQLLSMQIGGKSNGNFKFHPGYLISDNLSITRFLNYWFLNLGVVPFIAFLGFLKSSWPAKKMLLAFCPFFIIGNLFSFSPEMAANHKFFNLFMIMIDVFAAYGILLIWQKKIIGKIIALALIFIMTLSGIIDFFPIANDSYIIINDAPKNPDIAWIQTNTPPRSIFLNNTYLYHPANLAGRPIFLGWPYFPWAGGLDAGSREKIIEKLFAANNLSKKTVCFELIKNKIDYVSFNPKMQENYPVNYSFWITNFVKKYENQQSGFQIFSVKESCL